MYNSFSTGISPELELPPLHILWQSRALTNIILCRATHYPTTGFFFGGKIYHRPRHRRNETPVQQGFGELPSAELYTATALVFALNLVYKWCASTSVGAEASAWDVT